MSTPDDRFPIVIIGGGLAGLTAAVHLAQRGIAPLVLEADSRWIGGRLAGGDPHMFEYQGRTWSFAPDYGMHALWGNYDNMRAMLQRFTDTRLIPSVGEEWINRWGREVRVIEAGLAIRFSWIPAPFHYLQLLFLPHFWRTIIPLDFLSLPGYLFSMLWATGYDPIKEQSALDGLNMKEFFRGWTPNLRASFTGLGINLLAAPPETISLSAFIAALRFYTVLRRDSWQMHYLPANSHHSIIQPLKEKITTSGGQVSPGATAQRIERKDNHWRIIVEDSQRGGLRSLEAVNIILAVDAPAAERLLCASPDTAPAATQLKFPPALRNVVIRMWFNASPREGTVGGMFTGDFVPDNFFWLHRMASDHAAWHEATGGSSIEVHVYGSEDLLNLPDRNLLILAVDDIQRAFPELKGHFIHGEVQRNSRTHTQFRVPTSNSLHVNTPWQNIYACGDWIGYPSPSLWMERATVTGIAAANHVLEAHELEPYPVLVPKHPERLASVLGLLVRGIRLVFSPLVRFLRYIRRQGNLLKT